MRLLYKAQCFQLLHVKDQFISPHLLNLHRPLQAQSFEAKIKRLTNFQITLLGPWVRQQTGLSDNICTIFEEISLIYVLIFL